MLQSQGPSKSYTLSIDEKKEILDARFELACNAIIHKSFFDYLGDVNGERDIFNKLQKHPAFTMLCGFLNINEQFVKILLDYITDFSKTSFTEYQEYSENADYIIFTIMAVIRNSKFKEKLKPILEVVIASDNAFWSRRLAKFIRNELCS